MKIYIVTILTLFFIINTERQLGSASSVLDFDGDGQTDLLVRRNANAQLFWYVLGSRNGQSVTQWGTYPTTAEVSFDDFPVSQDYDGDGKWDIAVWRKNYNTDEKTYFYIYFSETNTFQFIQWGLRDDQLAVQDYDGDGKADPAVFRSIDGTWFILQSRDGLRIERFGQSGDRVLFGDYDGDGRADLAIYRRDVATVRADYYHYVQRSSDNSVNVEQFGYAQADFVTPGDYDGDGRTDIAVWRGRSEYGNGTWYWHRSSDGQYEQKQWGTVNTPDFPVQGDYDGDGKTDVAVWRRNAFGGEQAYFFIDQSRDGVRIEPWGLSTDGIGRQIAP